jgi:hypothetical protein
MELDYLGRYGEGVEAVSLLAMLRDAASFVDTAGVYQVRGGNDLLPRALSPLRTDPGFFPHIQAPEGRVHFAGDTIGGFPGYIESAMLSARAAAEAINRAP